MRNRAHYNCNNLELHERFKIMCIKEDVEMHKALEEAIETWMKQKRLERVKKNS